MFKFKKNESDKKIVQKKKAAYGFDAGIPVIIITSQGFKIGRVLEKVKYLEGQAHLTNVCIELLPLSKPHTASNEDVEELQSNDTGMIPQFWDDTTFEEYRMLMRLDSRDPLKRFVWGAGRTITTTADLVFRGNYINLIKLMLKRGH